MKRIFSILLLILFLSFSVHGIFNTPTVRYQLPNQSSTYQVYYGESLIVSVMGYKTHNHLLIYINGKPYNLTRSAPLQLLNLSDYVQINTPRGVYLLKVVIEPNSFLRILYIVVGVVGVMLILLVRVFEYHRKNVKRR